MKKTIIRQILALSFIAFSSCLLTAQSAKELISEIKSLMLERYIFLDQAKAVIAQLEQLEEQQHFEQYTTAEELAEAMTQAMRSISNDKHLGVLPPRSTVQEKPNEFKPSYRNVISRYSNPMIPSFQYIGTSVGYFDMRYFGGGERNYDKIDAVMTQLKEVDALIVDLRSNGGGSPRTVQYLCSYFFDEHKLLSSLYSRFDDHTDEYWIVEVKGQKRPKLPIFVLTSSRTFSGAEDFAYTMQAHGKATVIGEVTRGGAHPTRAHNLSGGFRVRIPFARSIHPVTKSNWEGIGVQPDVQVAREDALEKAKELAAEAAEAYKQSYFGTLEKALGEITGPLLSETAARKVYDLLANIVNYNLVNENDINRLGYQYLRGGKKLAALALLKANSQLFPESPNVYDSYAEVLVAVGDHQQAITNLKIAVDLAIKTQHPDLEYFQRNLTALAEN
ncbi:MAG: S41 family peptidase [Bacteroidota bacterium]